MPKWFSASEKELISKRLLEQGYKLFTAYGLKKANVEEIARAAGISKGAFYNFYESKEALFLDVIEEVEIRFRQDILLAIDQPGPSPRARLLAVFKRAFAIFETIPILQLFTGGDYELLFSRIPPEKLQEHLSNDQAFFGVLMTRCQEAGIPIRVQPEQIVALLYPIVIARLHTDDFGRETFSSSIDMLLDLAAAYSLGEVELIQGK